MIKFLSRLPSSVCLVFLGLLGFSVTAHAANAVLGEDTPMIDLAKAILQAFTSHQWTLSAPLIVILLVAVTKRYLGDRITFLHTNAGGTLTALVVSTAATLAAALGIAGTSFTATLLWTAFRTGLSAAGGYAVLKNVVVEPVLRPLVAHAPAWIRPILDLLLFAFDHNAVVVPPAIAVAETAGTAAVAVEPGTGVGGVVGRPGDLP